MEKLNYESYYYSLNIAGYEKWSDDFLLFHIEKAKEAIAKMDKDVYDKKRIKSGIIPPRYVADGYRWANNVIYQFEQELKNRGVMERDELEFSWDELLS